METDVSSRSIRLMAEISPEGQSDSVIPIRWCVSREVVQELRDKGISSPHFLISVTNAGHELERRLVPLADEMVYLQFTRPGQNVVHATIVWHRYDNGDELKKAIFSLYGFDRRGYPQYSHEVLTYGKDGFTDFDEDIGRHPGQETLSVEVPAEMFAKEPPRWLKRFVGYFFDVNNVDQCHFRRRLILSILAIPLAVLWVIGKELVTVGSLIVLLVAGRREINFHPVLNPIRYAPDDTWQDVHSSFWFVKKNGDDRFDPVLAINPLFMVISGAVTYFVTMIWSQVSFNGDKAQEQHLDHLWTGTWWIWLIAFGTPLAIYFVISLGAGFVSVIKLATKTPVAEKTHNRWQQKREQQRREKLQQTKQATKVLYSTLEEMVCNGDRRADLKELPKERRTLRLRFQATKAKVCRPYAR